MRVIVEATKEMIFCAQRSSEWCIVDARSSDAYIGWKHEEEIGGHIPYARLFSSEWLKARWRNSREDYETRLLLQLESQGISPGKNVIVYDESGKDAEVVCDYFGAVGIENLFYYNLNNWDGDLFKYPNRKLMAPMWMIKDIVDGKENEYFPGRDIKIFEVAWKEPSKVYLENHIPGAVHVDSDEFESGPQWTMPSDEGLLEFAMNNGITPETVVIIYGNTPMHFSAAAKMAVVLRYMGIKDVMCMNGILKNWVLEGYPTESGNVEKSPCECKKEDYVFHKEYALHMKEAKELLNHPELGTVIDIRDWKEYIGEDSGYDYLDKAGRIPGTKWCYYPGLYMTPVNQIGNLDVMLGKWEQSGIDLQKTMAFFCGSASWGASVCEIFAHVAGFNKATIFEGGWCEWCDDPQNPVETGIPEEWKDYDPEKYYVSELVSEGSCHVM